MEIENEQKLSESINGLSREVKTLNSLKRSFFRGVIFGLGSVIGASILAALLITALNQALKPFGGIPNLNDVKNIEIQK